MSEVPAPNFSDAHSPSLRRVFALFGRGIIYAVAFWLVYLGLFRWYPGSSSGDDDKLHQRQATQMNTYDEQARKTTQMLLESERQQTRMNAVISKQEEQAKRFDAILDRWERQAGVRK
jgi:hypothetical protein